MALLIAVLATITPAPLQAQPPPQLPDGCRHTHPAGDARQWLRTHVRSDRPWLNKERVRHVRRCVASDARRTALTKLTRRWRDWRQGYGPRWRIRFNRLEPWEQAWARNTSWCESRGNRYAVGAGGLYYSYFQWLPSTWYAAGGDRWPTAASWDHQAVLAVRWMLRYGAQHWPVCGR